MFIIDDIAYAGEPTQDLKVSSASVVNDWCMVVTFSTGEQRVFDATVLFQIPAFEPLRDSNVFESFEISYGILTWSNGEIDIAPEAIYQRSYEYESVA